MTPLAALLAFTVAAAILTLTPGLDTALVLRTALREGQRRALLAGVGISAGCVVWGVLVAFGLGSLLAASQLAYDILRICGAAYLCYLGLQLLWRSRTRRGVDGIVAQAVDGAMTPPSRDSTVGHSNGATPRASSQAASRAAATSTVRPLTPLQWFLRGCLTNLLNPKIGVFYVTLLPQFVPAGADVFTFTLLLAAVHAVLGVTWFAVLAAATRPLNRWLSRPSVARGLDRLTGAVFIAFGMKLALERR
ncbi:LysE family translocator [Bordetella genomosp. 13]|uniref:LysE family translocator n=1 Tax=Bordetella genomosp. 13 TaxID=463040 RepID=UPI0011A3F4FC|nr:LysE family translocator [Bordetella genomosp. 13]